MKMHELPADPGKKQKPKRIGRGNGSGQGTTAGKGSKGQKSRAGVSLKPGFEGGQTSLVMRSPKRGFRSPFKKEYCAINVDKLERFDHDTKVDPEMMRTRGLFKGKNVRVKILGNGTLSKKLTVKAHAFSTKAQDIIAAAGGSCELVP